MQSMIPEIVDDFRLIWFKKGILSFENIEIKAVTKPTINIIPNAYDKKWNINNTKSWDFIELVIKAMNNGREHPIQAIP